jgi:protein involved in polysaccharide export with SLBB domain
MNCASFQIPPHRRPRAGAVRRVFFALLIGFAALKISAADTNANTNSLTANVATRVSTMDDKYKLSIGDQLSFQIIEDEEDPKTLTVTDSGDLQVPYIGRFPAAGKTCKELAGDLKKELEKNYYYHATVIVAVDAKPRSRGKIYIVGAIRTPGPQEMASDETLTVSRAILRAGSFTEFADEKNIRITRSPGSGDKDAKKIFTVDVGQIFEKSKTENDLALQPGDLIFVPERMIRF